MAFDSKFFLSYPSSLKVHYITVTNDSHTHVIGYMDIDLQASFKILSQRGLLELLRKIEGCTTCKMKEMVKRDLSLFLVPISNITSVRWYVSFTNDCTQLTWIFLMKDNSEVA
ncbi:hypothetical protein CR513_08396, partial [Mucuna pruriens]